jgi:UDP-glucose 4-epimerase
MRILVTGHKGAIGSRLVEHLKDHEIIGIDHKDGQDILTCALPENIDLIYHLAAHASVEDSWKDPVRDSENITTTIRLAHSYPDTRIIYASSCATINPASPYGFSKKCAMDYLKLFHSKSTILYFPNVFGTGRSVVDFFKGKDKVTIFGDGTNVRDYVHVDDIAKALVKAMYWPLGDYFLGSGKSYDVLALAEGKEVIFAPARKEATESLIPNTTPNWHPTINVIEYLND